MNSDCDDLNFVYVFLDKKVNLLNLLDVKKLTLYLTFEKFNPILDVNKYISVIICQVR